MRYHLEDMIEQCPGVKDVENRVRVNRADESSRGDSSSERGTSWSSNATSGSSDTGSSSSHGTSSSKSRKE
jgi:hypothetical protein